MAVKHTDKGAGAPTTIPPSLSAHYLDTQNLAFYMAAGTATEGDWVLLATGADLAELLQNVTASLAGKADAAALTVLSESIALALAGKVATEPGKGLSSNDFTTGEKNKLAGLESSHFKGVHASLAALQSAHATAVAGDYADVDTGAGQDVLRHIWDASDGKWVPQSAGTTLTAAQVKNLYESNPNTNGFTDADKDTLLTREATLVPGANVSIDRTNPLAPVINVTQSGGGEEVQLITEGRDQGRYLLIPFDVPTRVGERRAACDGNGGYASWIATSITAGLYGWTRIDLPVGFSSSINMTSKGFTLNPEYPAESCVTQANDVTFTVIPPPVVNGLSPKICTLSADASNGATGMKIIINLAPITEPGTTLAGNTVFYYGGKSGITITKTGATLVMDIEPDAAFLIDFEIEHEAGTAEAYIYVYLHRIEVAVTY